MLIASACRMDIKPAIIDQNHDGQPRIQLRESQSQHRRKCRGVLALMSLGFAYLWGTASACGEEAARPPSKWRPKDGIYVAAESSHQEPCPEASTLTIELGENAVSGYEWGCKINRLTDTAPDAIKLDMTCNDYNLALNLYPRDPKAEEKSFKETMLLKRIDEGTISVRKTLNGRFDGPAWPANLCPADIQRVYAESKVAAAREAAEKEIMRNPWRPKPGIYAIPDIHFDKQCHDAADAIIDLDQRAIVKGPDKCSVTFIRDSLEGIQLFVTCNTPSSAETAILRKIDEKTVFLRKTQNKEFEDAGAYCPEDVQRMYSTGGSTMP